MRKKIHESDAVMMQLLREIHEWEARQDLGNRPMWWFYREGTEEPRWWYATPWHERRRARRIRDKQRMKAKARRTFEQASASMSVEERQIFLLGCERLADNLAHCRKRCCNKRRFWEGPNIQERRALAKAKDMMKRSPHLSGPRRVDVHMEIRRRLERRIQQLLAARPRNRDEGYERS